MMAAGSSAGLSCAPVLIVGAGPSGLTLANALARYGVPYEIIDAKRGPSCDSKGLSVNLSSRCYLAALGIDANFGHSSAKIQRVSFFANRRRLTSIDLDRGVRGARLIAQPQSVTEAELLAALGTSGGHVQWEIRLTRILKADDAGCEVVLEDRSGRQTCRNFRFVVGCDGKRSTVREQTGVKMNGYEYPFHFVLADFRLPDYEDVDEVMYHILPDGFLLFVPISDGMVRVVVSRPGNLPRGTCPNADDIVTIANRYSGRSFVDVAPAWISGADFYMRQAERLRSGNVFLCGDAAHLVSPVGGTGMNMGIADAANLAWRLAYSVHGYAPATVLDMYEAERPSAISKTILAADSATRYLTGMERSDGLIATLAPRMENRPHFRAHHPCNLLGVNALYPRARKARDPALIQGSILPGIVSLRACLQKQGVQVSPEKSLIVLMEPGAADESMAWRSGLDHVLQSMGALAIAMRIIILGERNLRNSGLFAAHKPVFLDPDAAVQEDVCLQPGKMLLLRPDAVVAFGGSVSESKALQQAIAAHYGMLPAACS